jgi:hypothetical protein
MGIFAGVEVGAFTPRLGELPSWRMRCETELHALLQG